MNKDELSEVLDALLSASDSEVSQGIKKAVRLDDFSRWEDES